jgi:2-succinyl-5-enolpyruvyl-6-hydroxy-3-cyclohexene-1-carboxylate synthase
MTSNKKSVQVLIEILKKNNIRDIILCPGSRNAPLILAFSHDTYFNLYSIFDEKVAGFVALGMSKISRKHTVIVTTSGSAVINVAPAMLEAYYSNTPLILVSADRPKKEIHIGDNQTMKQKNVFKNYCHHFFDLDEKKYTKNAQKLHNELSILENQDTYHINMPFIEPLYETTSISIDFKFEKIKHKVKNKADFSFLENKKIAIYISEIQLNKKQISLLDTIISKNKAIVIPEILSNYHHEKAIYNFDFFNGNYTPKDLPDVLITIGNQMITKRTLFRNHKKWKFTHMDCATYNRNWKLSDDFIFIKDHLDDLLQSISNLEYEYTWIPNSLNAVTNNTEEAFIACLKNEIPENAIVYWGNSSIIRYAEQTNQYSNKNILNLGNRGISGIEGVLSTAIGSKLKNKSIQLFCILGDISALYEINSFLWTKLIDSFTIIVLNNQGGRIFERINSKIPQKSLPYFKSYYPFEIENLANTAEAEYIQIKQMEFNKIKNHLNNSFEKKIIEVIFED